MHRWRTILAIAALSAGLFVSTALSADLKDFKFGQILAMTGSGSWYGITMERGTSIAVEEINKAGGVAGYKLSYVVEDHRVGTFDSGTECLQEVYLDLQGIDYLFLVQRPDPVYHGYGKTKEDPCLERRRLEPEADERSISL